MDETSNEQLASLRAERDAVAFEKGLQSVAAALDGISTYSSKLRDAFDRLQCYLREQTNTWGPLVEKLAQATPEAIARAVDEWNAELDNALDILMSHGWVLHTTFPGVLILELAPLAKSEFAAMEAHLIQYYNADYLEGLLRGTASHEIFGLWSEKFTHAMKAHREGLHDLAVPIWLLAIDGILWTISGEQRFSPYKVSKKPQKYYKAFEKVIRDRSDPGYVQSVARLLYHMGKEANDDGSYPLVNRDRILHGRDPAFGSESESIRCVLLLHAVYTLIESAPKVAS